MIQKGLEYLAQWLYRRLKQSRFAYICFPKSVERDIRILGREEETYYIQKLVYLCGLSMIGAVLVVLYLVSSWFRAGQYVEHIQRPEAYEEASEVAVRTGRSEDVFHLEIAPVVLTREEAEAQYTALSAEMSTYILGKNESLEQVETDLILPDYVEGYPFDIFWASDDEALISNTGVVNREGLEEDCVVILTAAFQYKEWEWKEQFGVVLVREVLTEEEKYKKDLGLLLEQAESEQREAELWELPEYFEEEELKYRVVEKDDTLLLLVAMVFGAAIAIWIGQDQDLHSGRKKRREVFRAEYVSFAGSLSMYISAGLNLQGAMHLCTRDYIRRKPREHLLRKALEAFQKDLQNGCGFQEALDRLVTFTDDVNYRKLAGLLSQSMLNGSQGLASLLEKEVEKTREEKRRQCKVMGEQISTALIAPMMLQLGIVIALIMIPAFTGMQF